MKELFYSSKDEIRNRVLKNARDYWGLKHIDDLDPMVKLLLEALCTELFNISNEVKGLQHRMIDKMSHVLAADTLTSALPAHAVLHAKPTELSTMIDEKDSFVYHMRSTAREGDRPEQLDIAFSPLKSVHILQASVRYMATGNHLFRMVSDTGRSLAAKGGSSLSLEKNTLYIGIDWPRELKRLEGLTFYCDWPSYSIGKSVVHLLALSKWYMNNEVIKMELDRFYAPSTLRTGAPFEDQGVMNVLAGDIVAYYRNRFFSIAENQHLPKPYLELFPASFEKVFTPQDLDRLNTPLLWIKVEVPSAISQQALDELFVHINAFPVVNRKLHDLKHRLKAITDIIPMKTPDYEQFLMVESLRDLSGNRYNEIPQGYEEERSAGLYSVRYGGTERFDERSARDMLDYLFEVLRDEKAAFATYGTDFLHGALKELEQQVSLISQRTVRSTSSIREQVNYIVFKPLPKAEIMFLQYWSTNGLIANNIKTGSRLQAIDNSKFMMDSVYLLSSTMGGRDRPSAVNRTRAYKYGLTSANRIVTQRDLENFCWLEFGDYIQEIRIDRGLFDSGHPKQGFVRTVDIHLSPSANTTLKEEEWQTMLDLGLSKLRSRSVLDIHYRLYLTAEGIKE